MVVTLSYAGTTTNGVDYITGSTTLTIIAGATGIDFTITALQDIISENDETIIINIVSLTGVSSSISVSENTTTTRIIDDDGVQVLLSVDTGAMNESGGITLFTVYTSGDLTSSTGIVVTLTYGGTAISGSDYATNSITITILSGTTGASFSIT